MQEMAGDFEIHLTAWDHDRDRLAAFAEEHGLGYVYIELDPKLARRSMELMAQKVMPDVNAALA